MFMCPLYSYVEACHLIIVNEHLKFHPLSPRSIILTIHHSPCSSYVDYVDTSIDYADTSIELANTTNVPTLDLWITNSSFYIS